MSSANNTITLITPPDKYYGSAVNVLLAACGLEDQGTLLNTIKHIDLDVSLSIYDPVAHDDVSWLLDNVQQSDIVIIDLRYNHIIAHVFGWMLNKNNCYYFCDDSVAEQYVALNRNRIKNILEPLTYLEE
jgi:hypothetical protein